VDLWLRAGRAGERSHPDFPFGQYSDDTQLARELLLSFREQRGWDPSAYAGRIARLFQESRDVGAGSGTRSAALRLIQGVTWSEAGTPAPYAGNGSAIRAGPLGLLFSSSEKICCVAEEQSRITHRDSRCAAGAAAIALALSLAARPARVGAGEFLDEVAHSVEMIDSSVARALNESSRWFGLEPVAAAQRLHQSGLDGAYPEWQGISAFVTPSVLWSLYSFLRSPDDYWESVCTAIAVGGDTDSMAAMAGAISGARLGPAAVPRALVSRLNDRGEWRAQALALLARDCAALSVES
jgi:ADP-ribosylglycohydrolase